MGWETYLQVDGALLELCRSYAPNAPTLLFRRSNLDLSGDGVAWVTSVRDGLQNLRAAGFSWELVLEEYSSSRDFSIDAAFFRGLLSGGSSAEDYAEFCRLVDESSPADDLKLLATSALDEANAIRDSWAADPLADEPAREVLDKLLFGESMRTPGTWCTAKPQVERYLLLRASDYFVRSRAAAPLVGWAFAMVALLRHAPPDAPLMFDISQGIEPSGKDAATYAEEFWNAAQVSLCQDAEFYGRIFAGIASATGDLARAIQFGRLETMLSVACEAGVTKQERGRRLEALVAALLEIPDTGLAVLEKRLKHADEELDLVLRNELQEPFWRNFNSPLVLVECKNWSSRVDINELRVLESKMRDRGSLCSVGVFVALGGFSKPFSQRVRELQVQGLTIFPLERGDIEEIIHQRLTLAQWLRQNGLRKIL